MKMPDLLHVGVIWCRESEEDLKIILERFIEVCKRMSLKVKAVNSKEMVLRGEEGSVGRAIVDMMKF